MKVGILNPGMMGSAVAKTMVNSGHDVYWISAGRSDATRQRAETAGLHELTSGAEMVNTVEAIVSVCPPHAAVDVAEMVVEAGFKGTYLDANAIAPRTAHQIKDVVTPAGIDFIDGGIIGMPPTEPNTTFLYLSGQSAPAAADWFSAGPLETKVIEGGIGAASATKMCFAANSKGYNALLTALMGVAHELGVLEHVEEMWEHYYSGFPAQKKRAVKSVAYNKAWRFAGEMDEIANTWEDAGVPNGFYTAAAEVYGRIGHLRESEGEQTLEEVLNEVKKNQ